MENNPLFPCKLLHEPDDARLKYFKGVTIAHPLLKESFAKLASAVHEPAGSMLIFVVGPAGVGKTTLLQGIRRELIKDLKPILEKEPGRIPLAMVEAVGPESVWSWKDFYKRLLRAFDEPLIDYKTLPDRLNRSRGSGDELRFAVEQTILHRRPAAILVDEAQHIAKTASGRKLQDQLDCIKSLANMTETVHLLFGSYELLAFRDLNAQLSRRGIYLPFHRYRADRENDVVSFKNVIQTFELHIPLKERADLLEHWEYLYERSIGCVGILKDWLTRVLADVLSKQRKSIQLSDLRRHAFSVSQCKTMITEAIDGEKKMEEENGSRDQLRTLLHIGLAGAQSEKRAATSSESSKSPSKRRRRVGEPNPKRRPIGIKPNEL
jgi:hypothetical protein